MPQFQVSGEDLIIIGTLIVLEGLLSADNALVLAMQVRHLAEELRAKALLYGLVGAFVLRGTGLFVAQHIVSLWWLCGIGAAYLLFLCIKHFVDSHNESRSGEKKDPTAGPGFWQTVLLVELTDIVFAVDSILVAVAFSRKMWVIITGAFLGIILLRLAATFFIRLLEKYPTLDDVAYALVGWAGIKLAATAYDLYHHPTVSAGNESHILPKWVFWTGMALIVVVGGIRAVRSQRSAEQCELDTTYDEVCEDLDEANVSLPPGPSSFRRGVTASTNIQSPTSSEDR